MANTPPTVDFPLVEQLGINAVANALGIGARAVRKWRSRGVPRDRHAAILALAETSQGGEPSSPADLDGFAAAIDEVRHNLASIAGPPDEKSPSAAPDDDDDAVDQAPAPEASAPPTPPDEQRPTAAAGPAMRDQRRRSPLRQPGGSAGTAAVSPTVAQETRKPVRLNRKTVWTVCGGLAVAVVVGLAHGMSQVGGSAATTQPDADDEPVYQPLGNAILPAFDYTNLPHQEQAALTAVRESLKEPEPEPEPEVVVRAVAPGRDKNAEEEEAALQSPLFPAGASASRAVAPASTTGSTIGDETQAALDRLRNSLPTPQDLSPQGQPSASDQQDSFLNAQLDEAIYLKNGLQKPLSDYEVKAGTVIPAALITGLNSDLPGEIIGQVTEHVYDTESGQHLLIPQGAKIFGRYNADVGYGQERAQIVWDRLIMPNGNSVQLEAMVGTDKAGYAGLADQVDHHLGRLFGAVILSSIISVGANLATDSGNDVTDALGDAAAQQAAQVGGRIVDRQLEVQPTITVRPGFKLNILVNKDMIFR